MNFIYTLILNFGYGLMNKWFVHNYFYKNGYLSYCEIKIHCENLDATEIIMDNLDYLSLKCPKVVPTIRLYFMIKKIWILR